MGGGRVNHRGIRGSAALTTARVDPAAVPAERLEAGEMRRLPFGGELLGAVRVRAAYAPIPLEAFDDLSRRLRAEEQAAYLQLLRLSWGEGRNFCRIAKRDLEARLGLSERRLLRVLDAVVAAGLARPLHRDNRGTLWRVLLPREADGAPLGDDVLSGRAVLEALPPPPVAARVAASPAAPPRPRRPAAPDEALARALAEARGATDPDGLAAAAREVRELVAEGQSPARIHAAIEAVRRRRAAREAGGTA
ncbi:MAG: hypothetical protein QM704_23505 [Anaeromyxobacteraceae bacterium]